jgi:hypothetical protein
MYSFIRKNSIISDKTFISSLAGVGARDVAVIENVRSRLDKLRLEILKERKSTKKESHE